MFDFKPTVPSPFDILPNEIVLEIMQYLKPKELQEALQVDKRFHSLITQSPKLMPNLPLTVGLYKGAENRAIETFNRRYNEISFKNIAENKWYKYMKQALTRIGSDVTKVTFKDCQFPVDGFVDILSCFPKVEKVNLISVGKFIELPNQKPIIPFRFPNLKDVQIEFINSVSWSFIKPLMSLIAFVFIHRSSQPSTICNFTTYSCCVWKTTDGMSLASFFLIST